MGRRLARRLVGAWKLVNAARVAVLNLLFLALGLAVLLWALYEDGPKFAEKNALVLTPRGTLVEQLGAEGPSAGALVSGGAAEETLLRDLVETIERGAEDPRIHVLVLELGQLESVGLSKLQEVGQALRVFRATGKPVIATADRYSQSAYYLAAHADEIYMHGMGAVSLPGFGQYNLYFKDALDRFEVEWHIFRVGKYKSAVEPYQRNEMSMAAREADSEWMGDLWKAWIADTAAARRVASTSLLDYAEQYDEHILRAGGDSAAAAVNAGLVDHTGGRDLVHDRLLALVGGDDRDFNRVDGAAYLAQVREESPRPQSGPRVAVIVARGTIMDGEQPPGTIGGDSTASLIRKARLDVDVKALVLRVDSGGGSTFASEVIHREFELVRAAGKPVVVSMGSVAASGGYWISTAADEIWASPTTITGSIGIFGMFPSFDRMLANRLGVHVDGVATTRFSEPHAARGLDPALGRALQSGIDWGYGQFLRHVAAARRMTLAQVEAVAQGRVWSGVDAHAAGLVDHLGGLKEAIASAASRAGLGEGYSVEYLETEPDLRDLLVKGLLGSDAATGMLPSLAGTPWAPVMRHFEEQARIIAALNDPRGIYAYALVDVD